MSPANDATPTGGVVPLTSEGLPTVEPERHAYVVRLRRDKKEEYLRLHADAWPRVLELMSEHGIRNYSIFLCGDLLFSYFEYAGTDFDRDMADLGAHPESQEWARLTDACQEPLDDAGRLQGLWVPATEVFHLD